MDADHLVARWALAHHSLITREAAHRCGLSRDQIRHRVRSGRWQVIRPDVWAMAGVVITPLMELAAAAWSLPASASHTSATWLLGLIERPPDRPELTASRAVGHRGTALRLHRTDDLATRDTLTINGIRCTNAVRTCIDMGARLSVDDLERLVDRALHQRLVHPEPLITRFLQLARRGRRGIATTRTVLTRLDPALEPAESDLESLLMQVLREHDVPLPVRQHPVAVGTRRFRIDVAYPDLRIAIESDGFADHGLRSAFEDDRERQNLLMLEGWTVLRFTWRQICSRPDWVAEQVLACLRRRQDSHPTGC